MGNQPKGDEAKMVDKKMQIWLEICLRRGRITFTRSRGHKEGARGKG